MHEETEMNVEKKQKATEKRTPAEIGQRRAPNDKVKRIPLIVGVCLGVLGALLLGVGMTAILEWNGAVLGRVICMIGAATFAAAFPAYKYLLCHSKRKCGEQTMKLCDERLNEDNQENE